MTLICCCSFSCCLSQVCAYCYVVNNREVNMTTMKSCLDCGKCFQAEKSAPAFELKSLLCLFSRSPFALRLMLIEKLTGKKLVERPCPNLIWRG